MSFIHGKLVEHPQTFFCNGIWKVVYRRANSFDEQGYNKIKIRVQLTLLDHYN
jgi:hypothetical protein